MSSSISAASQATRRRSDTRATQSVESNEELKALISAAPAFLGHGPLVPSRNGELLRWCYSKGLRLMQLNTLMSVGLYNEPRSPFIPSILY